MSKTATVVRWLALAVVSLLMLGGLASYGFAAQSPERGPAWLACAVIAVLGGWLLVVHPPGRRDAVALWFLATLLGLIAWTGIQILPLSAELALALNPALAPIVEGRASAGLPSLERLALAINPESARHGWAQLIAAALFFLGVWGVARAGGWRQLALLATGIALIEGFLGLVNLVIGSSGRAWGGVYNPNHHAALTLSGVPLALAYLWNRHVESKADDGEGLFSGRDPALIGVVLLFAALIGWLGAFSRGSLALGFPIVLAWFLREIWLIRLEGEDRPPLQRRLGVIALALVVIGGFFYTTAGFEGYSARLSSGATSSGTTDASRLALVRATWAGLAESRYLGLGLHGAEPAISRHFDRPTRFNPIYTHNDWVQFVAEIGWMGCLLIALTGVGCFLSLRRAGSSQGEIALTDQARRVRGAAVAGLATLVAHAAVDFHLRIPLVGFQALLLLAIILGPGRAHTRSHRHD